MRNYGLKKFSVVISRVDGDDIGLQLIVAIAK